MHTSHDQDLVELANDLHMAFNTICREDRIQPQASDLQREWLYVVVQSCKCAAGSDAAAERCDDLLDKIETSFQNDTYVQHQVVTARNSLRAVL